MKKCNYVACLVKIIMFDEQDVIRTSSVVGKDGDNLVGWSDLFES